MNESDGTSVSGARSSAVSAQSLAANGSQPREGHFVIAKCRRDTDSTTNNCNQETSDESDCEERLLTVFCRSGRLGAACYTLQTGELQILEEIVDRPPEHQIFLALFRQVEPVKILLDGKAQATFAAVVKQTVFATDTSDHGRCKLIFMSSKEYNFEACKRRILSLSLPSEPAHCSEDERVLFLRTAVDFSQTQSVHALGALLRYLDLNSSNLCMDLHSKLEFLSLRRISLADIVTMDEDTYRGLQIFSSLAHPSDFKKGMQGSNKEGLSLFKLFSKCSSTVGHKRLRVLMRHPTSDMETLARRQDVVAFFMRPQSDSIMRNICSSLRYIKNVNGILVKIKALSSKAYQWKSLYNTLYNAVLICELCEGAGGAGGAGGALLQQLAASDNNNLYEMALYMNRIIDFDLTKSEGKFTVKAGVDPDLDMKKQTMASLHGLMSETARVELQRLPAFVQECSMLYMPHLGYLLAVRAWEHNLTAEQKNLPDMKFMNNEYIHYKSKGCEELDVLIGDTYPEIVAHETRIMMRLTEVVLQNLSSLAAVVDRCAELDCLIAISKVSKELNFVRPQLTLERTISISQGRHPLLAADSVVPNDTASAAPCLTLLTGPNASGKSVYIKQIGLIVYLAHIGSFVPAARATVGMLAHVHSRLHATECIAAHMSAFLIDLRQMSLALQESSAHSLVLVDEFGKGTPAADGRALLAACLNTLAFRGAAGPHLVLATHYRDIRQYIVDTPIVKFLSLEYIISEGEPVFLFRVVEGVGDSSLARAVAAGAGVAGAVLRRADTVLRAVTNNELPPENKKIVEKLRNITDAMKNKLTREEI